MQTVTPVKRLRWLLLAAGVCWLLTLPVAWNVRQQLSTDGISYIEMASNAVQLSPRFLVSNGYWSPGYPTVLALMMKFVHPSLPSELAMVKCVDLMICAATYLCFTYFLFNFFQWISVTRVGGDSTTSWWAIIALAYTLLLIANTEPSLWYVHPDMLLQGIVYLAAGVCIRISLPGSRRTHYVALGLILALGYATKVAVFPLALILLAILFCTSVARDGRVGVAIAAASFLLASSPLIAALSMSEDRFTIGDSGSLNYAWHVRGVNQFRFLEGAVSGMGAAQHPVERIASDPPILKVAGPVKGSFPLWYDPSYWFAGIHPAHLNLRATERKYLGSLGLNKEAQDEGTNLLEIARRWFPLFAAIAVLALSGLRVQGAYHAVYRKHLWLLLWPVFAMLMYTSVVLHYRYLVSFLVLFWTGLFVAAWLTVNAKISAAVILTVAAAVLFRGFSAVSSPALKLLEHPLQEEAAVSRDMALARRLEALGIRPGDELAYVGWPSVPYYARLIGARISYIIIVSDRRNFEGDDSATAEELPSVNRAIASLHASGAKAVLGFNRSRSVPISQFGDGSYRCSDLPEFRMYLCPLR